MATVELKEGERIVNEETYQTLKKIGDDFLEQRAELKRLQELVASYKINFELVIDCVVGFTGTFGLNNEDNTMIRESILNKEESPLRAIMKNVGSLMTDGMLAETNPEKKRQFEERFAFFQTLPQIGEFFKWQEQIKIQVDPEVLKTLPARVQKRLAK